MINKAVILAGGRGTRFLPYTKASAKEMIAIVDKPALHYIVEEVVDAGIKDILIIETEEKAEILRYFTHDAKLENFLQERGKSEELALVKKVADMAHVSVKHQLKPSGSGDAVMLAKEFADGQPFAILNGDDIMEPDAGKRGCLAQLVECGEHYPDKTIIGVQKVSMDVIYRYSSIHYLENEGRSYKVDSIVEKPKKGEAPSNLSAMGRYIVTPSIFDYIDRARATAKCELFLTDALKLQAEEEGIIAYEYEAKHHDTGNKLGYMQLVVETALRHEEFGKEFAEYIKEIAKKL